MPRISKALAAKLAPNLDPDTSWEVARDTLDLDTGGELTAPQLDRLTDWTIEARDTRGRPAPIPNGWDRVET